MLNDDDANIFIYTLKEKAVDKIDNNKLRIINNYIFNQFFFEWNNKRHTHPPDRFGIE